MDLLNLQDIKSILHDLKTTMDDHRDQLIKLDSIMGDGDLGLTMTRAFTAADTEAQVSAETLPGKLLIKLGMIMARVAPSTMGTLIATGFMRGGKAIGEVETIDLNTLAAFLDAFSTGIMERGKSKPGNKTILDVLHPASLALLNAAAKNKTFKEGMIESYTAAKQGLVSSIQMKAQHGRAAYYQDDSIGKQDAGATVGLLFIEVLYSYCIQ